MSVYIIAQLKFTRRELYEVAPLSPGLSLPFD